LGTEFRPIGFAIKKEPLHKKIVDYGQHQPIVLLIKMSRSLFTTDDLVDDNVHEDDHPEDVHFRTFFSLFFVLL
jgi:hypothetical protein